MKISFQWLRQYVDLADKSAEEVAEALPLFGLEVDGVDRIGLPPLDKVVVGEVLAREPHPDADRLSVCSVQTDPAAEPSRIVCGAKNFKVGDRVPVALPGAVLPGGFLIKKSKLRGVESAGMMCSPRELGLGDDHAGLMILDQRPEIGTPINTVYPDTDYVFDVEVTANRGDCLNHLGVARELAAWFGRALQYPVIPESVESAAAGPAHPLLRNLEVEASRLCPHYRAYSIRGVRVGPSPQWLRRAIESIGLRPVNNVVDATNFALFELGQPFHAFDAARIGGQSIHVRPARAGEKIVTLDEKERLLDPGMLVIADEERPLVIAGIMGSLAAEVGSSTTDIVLEAAYFDPASIRRTVRALGLSSDSSQRFERGIDPTNTAYAALRCVDLILQVAGGELGGPAQVAGEPPMVQREIQLKPAFVNQVAGFETERSRIEEVLESLELRVIHKQGEEEEETWDVAIPGFRVDLSRPVDLVEEFVRIHGTHHIPQGEVIAPALSHGDHGIARYNRRAAEYLVGQHFTECMHYSLREGRELRFWPGNADGDALALENPLASDQSHLRSSLVPGLLDSLKLNRARSNWPVRLFEQGRVFRAMKGQIHELVSVAFIWVQSPEAESWRPAAEPDFYDALIRVRNLLLEAGVPAERQEWLPVTDLDAWQSERAATAGDFEAVGWEAQVGLLSVPMLRAWDLEGTVLAGSLLFQPAFLDREPASHRFEPFSTFPPTRRDLALLVQQAVPAGQVRADLARIASTEVGDSLPLERIEVFDVYQGEGLPEGTRSLAFGLVFRASDRTLSDKEVNPVFERIQQRVTSETDYRVRS